jgi:Popeye protein conserved region
MNSFRSNCLIHAANVLLLLGYSVSDVLWLRLLAAASSLISIPYFAMQPSPLRVAIAWNVVFAAVNLFQSWRLFAKRRAVKVVEGGDAQTSRELTEAEVLFERLVRVPR